MKLLFWLRWAWRDLRMRWLQVLAIALIIALGTGIFSGLGGQEAWRIASMDRSYEELQLHDLRVILTPGSFVSRDRVLSALDGLDGVERMEPRLLMDTPVEAFYDGEMTLVAGQLVGADMSQGGPFVDRIHIDGGRAPAREEEYGAVLETKFARYYAMEPGARLTVIGGVELDVVGLGQSPEYFQIVPDQVGFAVMGESSLAVIYVPLSTAQAISGRPGLINELRIQFSAGADQAVVRDAVERRLASELPDVSARFAYGEDDPVRVFLYADAEEDQEMMNLIAIFFLLGAALAAFNLAGRIVESQRRQIGIGMALGVPRSLLAVRPLLVGLQIALIGTLLGLPLGFAFTRIFGAVTEEFMPLPYWAGTLLHPPSFLIAAALGVALPLLATLIPVWQAVRAAPLDAIHGHLAARSSGLNRRLKGLWLPGNSFTQMPLRNILRSPKRTLLTVLGLAVAMALLIMFLGLLDTFVGTLDQIGRALLYRGSDRITVTLDSFYPAEHEFVHGVKTLKTDGDQTLFSEVEPGLILGGRLQHEGQEIDTLIEFYHADSAIWVPALIEGSRGGGGDRGIVISRKTADDLGVGVGDTLLLEHPFREGEFAFRTVSTTLTVAGIHDNPVRAFSYMEMGEIALTGLDGLANVLMVTPAPGVTPGEIRHELFTYPGIAAVDAVADITARFDDLLVIFIQSLRIMQGAVLLIAFLIAFNSTSINIDDRIREVATMFAYGVRPRTVTWVQMGENALLGALGMIVGGWLGWVLLNRMMVARMETMLEDLELLMTLTPQSLILAVVLGIGVVALTPLVSARKLRRIDIPSTLRVME